MGEQYINITEVASNVDEYLYRGLYFWLAEFSDGFCFLGDTHVWLDEWNPPEDYNTHFTDIVEAIAAAESAIDTYLDS